jgi:transcriptional regulator with XRE-family HTH domain
VNDFKAELGLGGRIKALRKARGIGSTRELAVLTGGTVSDNILQNLEAGRKDDLRLSQFFNIAMALKVAPSYLLAPMSRPGSPLDLPDLSEAFTDMTVMEFDSWLIGAATGSYAFSTGLDRNERNELAALRELDILIRERRRLQTMTDVEQNLFQEGAFADDAYLQSTIRRLAETRRQITELSTYLSAAGWELGDWASEPEDL